MISLSFSLSRGIVDFNIKHQNAHLLLSIEIYSDQNEQAGEIDRGGASRLNPKQNTLNPIPGGIPDNPFCSLDGTMKSVGVYIKWKEKCCRNTFN